MTITKIIAFHKFLSFTPHETRSLFVTAFHPRFRYYILLLDFQVSNEERKNASLRQRKKKKL